MSISITIPMIETVHFHAFHICGVSKRCSRAISVHYNRSGKILGRTVKNGFGEPNHYGRNNETLGYSRNKSRTKVIHYDSSGKPVGYSRRVLWLFWIHKGLISKWDAIYRLW